MSTSAAGRSALSGVLVIDKPDGPTSHDVVAGVRRLLGVRRVGHAGTLDPMATGVLVVAVGPATRALSWLGSGTKDYRARVRLGVTTTTDDARGDVLAERATAGLTAAAVRAGLEQLTGRIHQVPPAVSAVKVAGRRAYARTRAGEAVELSPREVVVERLELTGYAPGDRVADLELVVTCSGGTYVRALARDLGAALGTGAHLTELRRTRVGAFADALARPLASLTGPADLEPLGAALARVLPTRQVDATAGTHLAHGRVLAPSGVPGPVLALAADGRALAVLADRDGWARPLVVFAAA